MAYLWPGLPHLWIAGSWAGLILALSFTVLFNLLLLTTLVWTEWLPPRVQLACGAILGVIWLAALLETRRELQRIAAQRDEQADENVSPTNHSQESDVDRLFRQSQVAYLGGNWLVAERTLRELLRLDRGDIEAQLLLATMWRHTGRPADARRQLDRLERLDAAAPWQFEIARERERIAAALLAEPLPPGEGVSPIAA
jgi:hypothetical protein